MRVWSLVASVVIMLTIFSTRSAAAAMLSEITRSCSSWVSVGDSPVVLTGQMEVTPAAAWKSICSRSRAESILPSRKGVTMATERPANFSARVGIWL